MSTERDLAVHSAWPHCMPSILHALTCLPPGKPRTGLYPETSSSSPWEVPAHPGLPAAQRSQCLPAGASTDQGSRQLSMDARRPQRLPRMWAAPPSLGPAWVLCNSPSAGSSIVCPQLLCSQVGRYSEKVCYMPGPRLASRVSRCWKRRDLGSIPASPLTGCVTHR